jgi:DNA-binding beta-propeller fold protein YncE
MSTGHHKLLGRATRLGVALLVLLALSSCAWFPDKQEPAYELVDSWGGKGSRPGQFHDPNGIAVAGGRVYVADSRNHRIQVFTRDGVFVEQWPVPDAGRPMNIEAGPDQLYVADYWNDVIRIYSLESGELIRSIGGPGSGAGELDSPGGVAVGPNGHIFVADFFNQRIQELESDGTFVRQWGTNGEKGYILAGGFNYPIDVDVADDGTLFVVDGYNDRI